MESLTSPDGTSFRVEWTGDVIILLDTKLQVLIDGRDGFYLLVPFSVHLLDGHYSITPYVYDCMYTDLSTWAPVFHFSSC